MNLEEYRTVFAAGSLVVMLIVAAPTLGLIAPFPRGAERFSEFWILGPNHMAEDYPFNVRVNDSYGVFVGVSNHMGFSSYYLVYVKFGNQIQPLPNATASEPSPLAPLYEFRAFINDGGTWEAPLTFSVVEALLNDDSMFVSCISINGEIFYTNASTKWHLENKGFYYQLFFELWLYERTSQSFQFQNRVVGIWLNVTT